MNVHANEVSTMAPVGPSLQAAQPPRRLHINMTVPCSAVEALAA
jgi:hypothetical protein